MKVPIKYTKGLTCSYRGNFSVFKETADAYYSSVIDSNDNISRLYISYPVFDDNRTGNTSSSRKA